MLCEEDVVVLMFLFVVKNVLATSTTKKITKKNHSFLVHAEIFFKNLVFFNTNKTFHFFWKN